MRGRTRVHLTYANVMSTLAVFIALGGSSYAALKITGRDVRDNSLTSRDIRNGSLTGRDVRNESLTGRDIRRLTSADILDGRLLARDFAPGELPAGPRGEKGEPGATNVVVRSESYTPLAPNTHRNNRVMCEPGERAVGGGAGMLGNAGAEELQQSYPANASGGRAADGDVPAGWWTIIENYAAVAQTPVAFAICVRP